MKKLSPPATSIYQKLARVDYATVTEILASHIQRELEWRQHNGPNKGHGHRTPSILAEWAGLHRRSIHRYQHAGVPIYVLERIADTIGEPELLDRIGQQ